MAFMGVVQRRDQCRNLHDFRRFPFAIWPDLAAFRDDLYIEFTIFRTAMRAIYISMTCQSRGSIAMKTLILGFALFSPAFAQNPVPDTSQPLPSTTPQNQPEQQSQPDQVVPMAQTPTFKINVVGRTTPAINYHYRSGATKVDLVGTSLAPKAHG